MRDIIAPFPALKVIFLKIFSAVFTYSHSANCKEVEYFFVWILWMNSLASGLRKGPTFSYTETAASLSLFDRYFVDVHPNRLNWFHFLILMANPFVVLIGCMIFLSPFLKQEYLWQQCLSSHSDT